MNTHDLNKPDAPHTYTADSDDASKHKRQPWHRPRVNKLNIEDTALNTGSMSDGGLQTN